MINIEEKINQLSRTQSDINEHLVTLTKYAKECETVTEMGVRWGDSTWAFLYASPKRLRSYDIQWPETWDAKVADFEEVAEAQNVDYKFVLANVLNIEIDECDLLFIDTWHAYKQLKAELALHADKAKKYIVLHDTTSFANHDEESYESWGDDWKGSGEGIWKAVEEFLQDNPEWELKERFTNNNGLTILARK